MTPPVRHIWQLGVELIEEAVQEQLAGALGYASSVLEHVDATQRLTHVAMAASITGEEYRAWRTQRKHYASPLSMSLGTAQSEKRPVHVTRPGGA